ncbi:MAG: hypothetical protein DMF50_00885 [Acidobacteria bacterium]|nr:MAG: hypothetical protein DMF50_00885 [Acidobacteriota bacterium]
MKLRPRPPRPRPAAAVALVLALLLAAGQAPPARAGGNLEAVVNGGTAIANAAWNARALPIPWRINDQGAINNCNNGNPTCVAGASPLTLQRAIDVLTAALNTWQSVPTSTVAFTFAGTSALTNIGTDNVHLITWADTNPLNCPSGVIAVTPNTHLAAPLTVSGANRDVNADGIIDIDPVVYPDGTLLPAGTIIDADVAWCPGGNDFVDEPLDTTTNTFDVGAVGTHELGHFHGLAHSSLIEPVATMFPFVDNSAEFGNTFRTLSQDDIASTSRYYPDPSAAAAYGAIAGRLFLPGGTTPADGASVTAFNRATGEMTVQVFSVSRFTATGEPPGSFRIDGLPPGTYDVGVEYFDHPGSSATAIDSWWDPQRYNLTVLNSNVTGGSNPPAVRAEFLSALETSTDDLEVPDPVTVTAGTTSTTAPIIIDTDDPPVPAGATALNLVNSDAVLVAFPAGFSFPFYGQTWSNVYVQSNGNLTFGTPSASPDSRNFLGPDINSGGAVPPRIAALMTNLNPGIDNKGGRGGPLDVFARFVSDAQGDREEILYQGVPVTTTTKSCTAIIRLFGSGRIEIQYRFWSAWWGVTGLSPGGSGQEPAAAIDFTRRLPFPGATGQAIYEHFEFAQPVSFGGTFSLSHAFDLNGQTLIFTPNAQGGYDATSPDLAVIPPGEIQNLRLTGATDLAWDPRADALTYDVYRGSVATLRDTNGDGAAESYGACLDSGLTHPADVDATVPPTGGGFFYLVAGRNSGGAGTLGAASSGAARPNVSPCP